jgi:hypothetical protein
MEQLSLFGMELPKEPMIPLLGASVQENYLQRQERVLSLLRQKKERRFKKDNFLEMFNMKRYDILENPWDKLDYVKKRICKAYIRPILDEMEKENAVEKFRSIFTPEVSNCMKVSLVEECCPAYRIAKELLSKRGFGGILEVVFEGRRFHLPFGENARLTKGQVGEWRLRWDNSKYSFQNAEELICQIVLLCKLREHVLGLGESAGHEYIRSKQKEWLEKYVSGGVLSIAQSAISYRWIFSFLESEGISDLHIVSDSAWDGVDRFENAHVATKIDFILLYLFADEVEMDDAKWMMKLDYFWQRDLLVNVIDYLFSGYIDEKNQEKVRKINCDHAASWMTKKNISDKVLHAMETTSFNDYFGYVEFDNEVDLSKVREIAREWNAIAEFMHFAKRENVQLRFRKLAHHHASGLYYPHCQCICVDVRNPDSMAHEYMHMLDDVGGNVSRTDAFYEVRRLYKKASKEILNKQKVRLKGKYNESYYFSTTEIFARCGEIYLTRILNIQNSLVMPDANQHFAYPDDENLLEAIGNFFALFFKKDVQEAA